MEGAVVWLTGIPATGKTTVAQILRDELTSRDVPTLLLDSDDLRRVMTPNPSYSDEERDTFYATIGHVASLAAHGGSVVIVSATAPKRTYRDHVRAQVESFVEVLLICDPEVLELRDPKGLYAKAKSGEIHDLPGYDLPYEDPREPELIFDSGRTSATEIAMAILRLLEKRSEEGGLTAAPPHARV
jgi:adenylylsulfate kinase